MSLGKKLRARQDISDEIQKIISLIRYELQNSIKKVYPVNSIMKDNFVWIVMDNFFEYETYGKTDYRKEHNIS